MVKPTVPGTFLAERYPVEHFHVWPEGTVDTDDNYESGANVSVEHLYASNGRAVRSIVTAVVRADGSNTEHVALTYGPDAPPLSLELENEIPSDERTLNVIRSVAAVAIAGRATLSENQ
jgi:hypothetical protein